MPGIARTRGFTLIEMIVALALAALMMAVVPAAISRLMDSVAYRSSLRDLATDLRVAHDRARAEGRMTVFVADVREGRFGIEGESFRQLPDSLSLGATVAALGPQDGLSRIFFYPDGGSSGGTLEVHRHGGDGSGVRVDWLLGSVSVYRLAAGGQ